MPPKWPQGAPESDEETPLLRDVHPLRKETSLPVIQILLLLLLQLSEPITSFSIRPYVNQVRSSIPVAYIFDDVSLSLSASSQSLVVMKKRSDTTQGY
jgi:hypothetical protein